MKGQSRYVNVLGGFESSKTKYETKSYADLHGSQIETVLLTREEPPAGPYTLTYPGGSDGTHRLYYVKAYRNSLVPTERFTG
jgi:hypothetical protein